MYDVAIIGAGVIGTFIARELSRYKLNTILIEKDNDVSNGTTKANSAIIHAGYDAKPGTNMAKFNSLGNPMFDKVCKELDVPFRRIGSLVIAFEEEDMQELEELYDRGQQNNISDMKILDKEKVEEMEPNINNNIIGALYAPTCGIIGPWELSIALAENALENGVELSLNSEVIDINKLNEGYKVITKDKEIETKYIINCAGVYADKINNMVSSPSFTITPYRGQYYLLDKSAGDIVNKVLFQCPTKYGKGVLVAPTVHGNIIVGPDKQKINYKEELETTADRLEYVKKIAEQTSKKIPFIKTITTFAGLRAESSTGDFIIEESNEAKGFINVAGMKSPALSSSPAIAEYVVEILNDITNGLEEKENFNPNRRKVVKFMELSDDQKAELIKTDPRYGRVICRCENITEGEIIDAIKRKAGATTVDGIKRRVRAGSGRCQGGFCGPKVMEILARELGVDMTDILKDNKGSYILTGQTKVK